MCSSSKSIITFHGDVETTSFFMTQIEKQLEKDGYHVCPFYFDAEHTVQESRLFLTFNFAGLYGEDLWLAKDGEAMVDRLGLTVVNIIVDHPYHYHAFMQEQISKRNDRYYQICIDRKHQEYMQKYFPQIKLGPFLPSAGTEADRKTSFADRPIEVLFTGTYIRPESFDVFIQRKGPEYATFYHSMLTEVYENPSLLLENVVRRRLQEEIAGVTEAEIRETLGHIQFLDYYIRFQRRGEVIRSLADAGIKLHVVGSGWDTLECRHAENISITPYLTSQECLERLTQAKFSLNILPCFHDGGHDRIFNSMLCGAVCVTDSNTYLDSVLRDGTNALVYSHDDLGGLSDRIRRFLKTGENGDWAELAQIAENGYEMAKAEHSWEMRCHLLEAFLEELEAF